MNISSFVARVRQNATLERSRFPAITWRFPDGRTCLLNENGHFEGLDLLANGEVIIEAEVKFPAVYPAAWWEGQALEVVVTTLFPCRLEAQGRVVFEDNFRVPVAVGPALVEVLPEMRRGETIRLRHVIKLPGHQISPWHRLRFSTPALRARAEQFDVLASQFELAAALAETPREKDALERAMRGHEEGGENGEIEEILSVFAEKIGKLFIHVVGHSHIDLNWLWTWPDTREVIRRDFRSVLGLMDEFPELTFSHSQPVTYEVIAREEPALFEKVRAHIRSGRWEPISMTWVEQDSFLTGGEAHARQLLHGVRYTRDVLGFSPVVYHAPDTFGHPGNLPQLAASAGAKYYYHFRCNPGGDWPAYWWEGQDGSRVLALCTFSYNGTITAGDLAAAALRAWRHGFTESMYFHGIGDHGGGPTRHGLEALRRFQRHPLLPRAQCSTIAAYGARVRSSGVDLPVFRGESRTIFEGCYTTHGDTKAMNRRGENALLAAETLAALAGIDAGGPLDGAWRKVLFNQFHDILAGSAIHEVYEGHAADFREVQSAVDEVAARARPVLAAGLPEGTLAVMNTLPEPREDWVFVPKALGDPGGAQAVPGGWGFVAKAQSYGVEPCAPRKDGALTVGPAYGAFDLRHDDMLGEAAAKAPYFLVETPHFRVYVRRDSGIFAGFLDKRVNRELVGYGMRRQSEYLDTARPDLALNVLQILEEKPHRMSAWQMHEVWSERSLITGAETRVLESGPARCVIEARHSPGASVILQRAIFYADLPWVDFETEIDWQEPGNQDVGIPNLKVSFHARLEETQAWFEGPFGAVRRPADGQETPVQRWLDVGGDAYGVALLNDSKYGCDVLGGRLRLSLVRSAYDPDAIADIGRHLIRYRLVPHPGSWREAGIPALAASFNRPLTVFRAPGAAETAASVRPVLNGDRAIAISCLKPAADGRGIILRLHDREGTGGVTRIEGLPAAWDIFETDLTEQDQGRVDALRFTPWQVRTFRAIPKSTSRPCHTK